MNNLFESKQHDNESLTTIDLFNLGDWSSNEWTSDIESMSYSNMKSTIYMTPPRKNLPDKRSLNGNFSNKEISTSIFKNVDLAKVYLNMNLMKHESYYLNHSGKIYAEMDKYIYNFGILIKSGIENWDEAYANFLNFCNFFNYIDKNSKNILEYVENKYKNHSNFYGSMLDKNMMTMNQIEYYKCADYVYTNKNNTDKVNMIHCLFCSCDYLTSFPRFDIHLDECHNFKTMTNDIYFLFTRDKIDPIYSKYKTLLYNMILKDNVTSNFNINYNTIKDVFKLIGFAPYYFGRNFNALMFDKFCDSYFCGLWEIIKRVLHWNNHDKSKYFVRYLINPI